MTDFLCMKLYTYLWFKRNHHATSLSHHCPFHTLPCANSSWICLRDAIDVLLWNGKTFMTFTAANPAWTSIIFQVPVPSTMTPGLAVITLVNTVTHARVSATLTVVKGRSVPPVDVTPLSPATEQQALSRVNYYRSPVGGLPLSINHSMLLATKAQAVFVVRNHTSPHERHAVTTLLRC